MRKETALKKTALSVSQLRKTCNLDSIKIATTAELPSFNGLIGQPRAVAGLRRGLLSVGKNDHIRLVGEAGVGRISASVSEIESILSEYSVSRPFYDFCCVYNFDAPNAPKVIRFARGSAISFKRDMEQLRLRMRQAVPEAFVGWEYAQAIRTVQARMRALIARQKKEVLEAGKQYGVTLRREDLPASAPDGQGYTLTYVVPEIGEADLANIAYANSVFTVGSPQNQKYVLPPHFVERWAREQTHLNDKQQAELIELIFKLEHSVREEGVRVAEEADQFVLDLQSRILRTIFDKFSESFSARYPQAREYLQGLRRFISKNISMFIGQGDGNQSVGTEKDPFLVFDVNVLVSGDREDTAPPVIVERNPTFANVVGKIIRGGPVSPHGPYGVDLVSADHMSVKAGALPKANGGFLILPLAGLSMDTWRVLTNALESKKFAIEDRMEMSGILSSDFKPEPIDLDVRVILVVENRTDAVLSRAIPEQYKLFGTKAKFVSSAERTPEIETRFLQFLGDQSRKNNIPHCTKKAAARVIEYASELAEDSGKVSLDFSEMRRVLFEAAYCARIRGNGAKITGRDVEKALDEMIYRVDDVRERMREAKAKGIFKMAGGKNGRIGRANVLGVYSTGDFTFGSPFVVSAGTSPGSFRVVNVERSIEMADSSQKKSVDIISAYFKQRYGGDMPISLDAQILFEQLYARISGDSASIAEFLVVLSDLAKIPILPNVAMTGSMSQHGDVQAIGGVGFKIEGFYDAWAALDRRIRPKGTPTVIIPRDNSKELMLRPNTVKAVKDGKLTVCAVDTIDDAMEIAMGMPAKEIDKAVYARLEKFSEAARKNEKEKDKKEE